MELKRTEVCEVHVTCIYAYLAMYTHMYGVDLWILYNTQNIQNTTEMYRALQTEGMYSIH